jgi:hypothetical protein
VVLTVLVATLVSVTGCGALPGGGGGGTPTADVSGVTLPAGVNESGLASDQQLLQTHRETLSTSGFQYRFDHQLVESERFGGNVSNTTEIDVTGTVRVAANLSAQRVQRVTPDRETVTWANDSTGATRIEADGVSYESFDPDPTPRLTTYYVLSRYVETDGWELVEVRDDGSRFVLALDTTVERPAERLADERTVRVSARMVVDDAGRIRRLNGTINDTESGTFNGTAFERTSVRRLTFEVTDTAVDTLPRPEWLAAAREAGALG